MKIIYPLFFIVLLSTCIMEPSNNDDRPNKIVFKDSTALDYQQYILPDKPTKHKDIPKFEEKAELGKVLYFTKINGAACSDCHSPKHGFTAGQQQSCGRGCEGTPPNRRPIPGADTDTPPIKSPSSIGVFGSNNLLWTGLAGSRKGPWEGLVHSILGQGILATNAHDMRLATDSVRANHPQIFDEFKKIYTDVDESRLCEPDDIAECLAAFQMRLIPNNSRFQEWLKGKEELSAKAKRGVKAFDTKCANCHKPPFLGDDAFMDVGFPHLVNNIHKGDDKVKDGRFLVTKKEEDRGKFRVMRLATNVTQHITWGHGGTFNTLEDCISGHQGIDSVSVAEIDDIIEFLNMTTDRDLLDMVPQ